MMHDVYVVNSVGLLLAQIVVLAINVGLYKTLRCCRIYLATSNCVELPFVSTTWVLSIEQKGGVQASYFLYRGHL